MIRPIRSCRVLAPGLLLGLAVMGAGGPSAFAYSSGIADEADGCVECTSTQTSGSISVTLFPATPMHLAAIAIYAPAASEADNRKTAADARLLEVADGTANALGDPILRPSALLKAHARHGGSRAYSFYRWPRRRSGVPPSSSPLD